MWNTAWSGISCNVILRFFHHNTYCILEFFKNIHLTVSARYFAVLHYTQCPPQSSIRIYLWTMRSVACFCTISKQETIEAPTAIKHVTNNKPSWLIVIACFVFMGLITGKVRVRPSDVTQPIWWTLLWQLFHYYKYYSYYNCIVMFSLTNSCHLHNVHLKGSGILSPLSLNPNMAQVAGIFT